MRIFKPSVMTSAKNLPGHTKLKFRQEGQSSEVELKKKDLRAELEAKEREHFAKKGGPSTNFEGAEARRARRPMQPATRTYNFEPAVASNMAKGTWQTAKHGR